MEIEAQLESLDNKIEKYNKKTDKLSKLVNSLVVSLEQNAQGGANEEVKEIFNELKEDYSKNQKGLNKKITELKTAITKANDTLENFSQGSVENIDVNKLFNLFDEFKTNTDLSNQTINNGMEKIENMLTEYNENLATINNNGAGEGNVSAALKSLNDEFYLDLLQLFNSISFEDEAEDLKEFMEDILSSITIKTDENSEKLNNIMLQFKKLLHKIESIEKTQNSISDYLKPEDADDLVYSFDDIQSDLAKMRLVLNEISTSISSQDMVEEISNKIMQTSSQIENISKLLGSASDGEEGAIDIRKKIETLNEQVYDISLRTNKLLLSNEDSTLELKNNLELFKEVFDKANPEKIYELFYELTHYFNDVNEKINEVTATTKASHTETVTIKNALVYVGDWLDNATGVLDELRNNLNEVVNKKNELDVQSISSEISLLKKSLDENIINIYARIKLSEENTQRCFDEINNKLDELLKIQSDLAKETVSKTTSTHLKSIDKKFGEMEETLAELSEKLMKE